MTATYVSVFCTVTTTTTTVSAGTGPTLTQDIGGVRRRDSDCSTLTYNTVLDCSVTGTTKTTSVTATSTVTKDQPPVPAWTTVYDSTLPPSSNPRASVTSPSPSASSSIPTTPTAPRTSSSSSTVTSTQPITLAWPTPTITTTQGSTASPFCLPYNPLNDGTVTYMCTCSDGVTRNGWGGTSTGYMTECPQTSPGPEWPTVSKTSTAAAPPTPPPLPRPPPGECRLHIHELVYTKGFAAELVLYDPKNNEIMRYRSGDNPDMWPFSGVSWQPWGTLIVVPGKEGTNAWLQNDIGVEFLERALDAAIPPFFVAGPGRDNHTNTTLTPRGTEDKDWIDWDVLKYDLQFQYGSMIWSTKDNDLSKHPHCQMGDWDTQGDSSGWMPWETTPDRQMDCRFICPTA
ncbi:hypothetical protein V8F20_007445 [Naviculisporaceae sp. PSN 640]